MYFSVASVTIGLNPASGNLLDTLLKGTCILVYLLDTQRDLHIQRYIYTKCVHVD